MRYPVGFLLLGLGLFAVPARAQPSLTYLRRARLSTGADTMDTFTSPRGIERSVAPTPGNGAYVIQARKPVAGNRWELSSTWYDSSGKVTAVQTTRTAPGSLATELEMVRALADSAALLVTAERSTGWVVPQNQPARLIDGPTRGERFAGELAALAVAQSKPAPGSLFSAPAGALYGPDPLDIRIDSIRVVRRDTLYRGATPLPVLVLERNRTTQIWVDERSGLELLSRGNAGPERWWWHIVRGVRLVRTP
jgi:hypothetical protein